jgi:hypothetical protein
MPYVVIQIVKGSYIGQVVCKQTVESLFAFDFDIFSGTASRKHGYQEAYQDEKYGSVEYDPV